MGIGTLPDLDHFTIEYDGEEINEISDVSEFFDLEDLEENTELGWLRFLTTEGLYVFIRIPRFSEHTITISSVIGALSTITMTVFYTIFCVVAFLVFLTRIFIHPVYLDYLKGEEK